ncbi:MarR family transcriptional regulator [Exiguobacterium sp. SH5S4]|uniref:MarR family winged helix-turn-helix transcriptional regulator n=1 Tax=Exiguobacterium sp. SH5S4 TaxID=2510961 RepID=UPI00103E3766|nr:MarR family transcriptional regulator [Exiguobacterium sp. SH5S4]TCI26426.1 MarR family transcriptional regulator [Exiguobacterium sp. SH5S4]
MELREMSRLLYQIKLADQRVATSFERETGFSLTRYEMLMIVNDKGVCSQSEIQQEMKIDNAAITRHLKILEEKGHVQRERNVANNREVFVRLTETAARELQHCEQNHDQTNHMIAKVLSESEMQQLSALLQKLNTI